MGVATLITYTDTEREAVTAHDAMKEALEKNGGEIHQHRVLDRVKQSGNWKSKVQFIGDFTGVIEDATCEDLAIQVWDSLGDYCWLSVTVTDGETISEKFTRGDYNEIYE